MGSQMMGRRLLHTERTGEKPVKQASFSVVIQAKKSQESLR